MYDIRFSTDSIFERVAHICHFGVMVGLAVIGPSFETWNFSWEALEQLQYCGLIFLVTGVFRAKSRAHRPVTRRVNASTLSQDAVKRVVHTRDATFNFPPCFQGRPFNNTIVKD
jgi:hypothetical protein